MNLFDPTTQSLEISMVGASMRSRALNANLANINTPGYRRVDIDFQGELRRALGRVENGQLGEVSLNPTVDTSSPIRADGNSVDVDQEGTSIAQNALEYQAAVTLLATRRRSLETIIRSSF